MAETTFENKINILTELWVNYRDDENFEDFFRYNDLGLPMAYAIVYNLVSVRDPGKPLIEEAFRLLLYKFEIVDIGFKKLDEILNNSDIKSQKQEESQEESAPETEDRFCEKCDEWREFTLKIDDELSERNFCNACGSEVGK